MHKNVKKTNIYIYIQKMYKKDKNNPRSRKFKSTIKRRFDDFHSRTRKIKMNVAEKMKKKYAGKHPYSPKYREFSERISFWKRMVKFRKNVNTSRAMLRRLARRIEVPWVLVSLTDLGECKANLKKAYQDYHRNKDKFEKWRDKYNESLIDALAKEQNILKQAIRKRIIREQVSRLMGRRARAIREKNLKLPVMRAVATDENGNNYECNSQETMVPVIAESNKIRQEQCVDTPFMTEPLLSDFGYLANEENTQNKGIRWRVRSPGRNLPLCY